MRWLAVLAAIVLRVMPRLYTLQNLKNLMVIAKCIVIDSGKLHDRGRVNVVDIHLIRSDIQRAARVKRKDHVPDLLGAVLPPRSLEKIAQGGTELFRQPVCFVYRPHRFSFQFGSTGKNDVICRFPTFPDHDIRTWSEQEKTNAMRLIEPDDLGQDAERRIVHDDAAIRILHASVIRARPEWTDNRDTIADPPYSSRTHASTASYTSGGV